MGMDVNLTAAFGPDPSRWIAPSMNVPEDGAPVRLQHLSRFLACQSCR